MKIEKEIYNRIEVEYKERNGLNKIIFDDNYDYIEIIFTDKDKLYLISAFEKALNFLKEDL